MKAFTIIAKVIAALATVAGAVYLIATYGDKIVAWAKEKIHNCPCHKGACVCEDADIAEEPVEEETADETPVEDAPAEEVVVEDGAPVADDADFEA